MSAEKHSLQQLRGIAAQQSAYAACRAHLRILAVLTIHSGLR